MLDIKKLQIHTLLNGWKILVKLRELDFLICNQEQFTSSDIWYSLNALSSLHQSLIMDPSASEIDLIIFFCFVCVYLLN